MHICREGLVILDEVLYWGLVRTVQPVLCFYGLRSAACWCRHYIGRRSHRLIAVGGAECCTLKYVPQKAHLVSVVYAVKIDFTWCIISYRKQLRQLQFGGYYISGKWESVKVVILGACDSLCVGKLIYIRTCIREYRTSVHGCQTKLLVDQWSFVIVRVKGLVR